jgi:DNA-binding NarL/FixJ family response regulator
MGKDANLFMGEPMHSEQQPAAVLKTCPRCGQTFQTSGGVYLCQSCKRPKTPLQACDKQLTFREKQIIQMVYEAKLNKEIAYDLHLSEGTIKEYLHRIFRKVGVKNRTDLALWNWAHREKAA